MIQSEIHFIKKYIAFATHSKQAEKNIREPQKPTHMPGQVYRKLTVYLNEVALKIDKLIDGVQSDFLGECYEKENIRERSNRKPTARNISRIENNGMESQKKGMAMSSISPKRGQNRNNLL